ncbi:MAG: hypothetical protein V2I48_14255 [Xanthomonadales bacterium]|jgi:hypothetical protein|nr:hypothetical protein [Xanthomonadales bacterium]
MKKILVALLALTTSVSAMAADGFSSLEEQMTGKEFMAAGLGKLSQQELDALNAWIRAHSLGTLDTPAGAVAATSTAAATSEAAVAGGDRRGLASDDKKDDSPIRSAIVGEFDGWDGQTIFKLENGMIWVQDDRDKFYVKDLENPVAVIEPGLFSSWSLHIEGYKSECKVKRIQ